MEADDRDKEAQVLRITVKPLQVGDDPVITIYRVELDLDNWGSWQETWGSKELAEAFLRGVEAGVSAMGRQAWVPPVSPDEETSRETIIREAFYAS